jgi:DNA-binding winged helix-turn-helix (wHTH) protein
MAAAMSRVDIHQFAIIKTERGIISLTRTQTRLFEALRAAGEIVADDALIAVCWPGQAPRDGDVHRLRVLVHQVRDALEESGWRIARYRQHGYQLQHHELAL